MKLINDYIMDPENKARKQEKRPWHYWICQKQPGQLSEVMANLLAKKREYKISGQRLKEKATKILMNSGYGVFGSAYFDYNDTRVAELITGFGQYTIKELEKYAGNKMIYGDTDSIYLESKDDTIITKAAELGVILEFERVWPCLFLSSDKKAYFGLTEDGKVIAKGLRGMKSDQPEFFNQITERLVSKEFMEMFIINSNFSSDVNGNTNTDSNTDANTNANTNAINVITDYIRSSFKELPFLDIKRLAYSFRATKALYDYPRKGKEKTMWNEILEDCDGDRELAKAMAQADDTYYYYKIIAKKKSITIHPELYRRDTDKHRKELFKCIEPILEAYGVKEEELERLRNELVTIADNDTVTIFPYRPRPT
jgi:DNA polymerase elongation subunit (family B)